MLRRPRLIRAWHLTEEPPVGRGQAATLEAALGQELVRQFGTVPRPVAEPEGHLAQAADLKAGPALSHRMRGIAGDSRIA